MVVTAANIQPLEKADCKEEFERPKPCADFCTHKCSQDPLRTRD